MTVNSDIPKPMHSVKSRLNVSRPAFSFPKDLTKTCPSLFLAPSIRDFESGVTIRDNSTTAFKDGTLVFCQGERLVAGRECKLKNSCYVGSESCVVRDTTCTVQ